MALTEGRHAGEFLISEAAGHRSRESVPIGASTTITPGMVVMVVDEGASLDWVPYADATFVPATVDASATGGLDEPVVPGSRIGIALDEAVTGVGEADTIVVITNNAEVTKGEVVLPGSETWATILPRLQAMHIFARPYGALVA